LRLPVGPIEPAQAVGAEEEKEAEEGLPEGTFLVEYILSHQHGGGAGGDKPARCRYLVKWEGYPESQATWEPFSGVRHTPAFEEYCKRKKLDE
jgi:hypothetical protein